MSQQFELTGKIVLIGDVQTFASGFQKRVFVIETEDSKFPQKIPLDAVKDGCDRLDAYRVGDGIKVSFNLRGNEYNGKYYVHLAAWKLEKLGDSNPPPARQSRPTDQNGAKPPTRDNGGNEYDEDDAIPFSCNPGINYF